MILFRHFAVLAIALPLAGPASADVLDARPDGFTVSQSALIHASRNDVYRAAVADVGEWWSDAHTMSGDASNMYIEARPQGCFCETLGDNGGVVHMTVSFVNPFVMLRLSGGLGPLGLMGVYGNMTWEFDDSDEGTIVTWKYAVGGYLPQGLEQIAPAVDSVLTGQLNSLKTFIESRVAN
ncbi:MAG TPA: hypothetical protein VF389_08310 [Woeseiaceae bacterium]